MSAPNPTGKGGFKKGQSGNPGGRTSEEIAAAKALNAALRGDDFQREAKDAYLQLLRERNPVIVKDYMDRVAGKARELHTTQKPLPLMVELVRQFTDPGDVVLDPFCGSGTTGAACLRTGRKFIGIERDEHYARVARERLEGEAPDEFLSRKHSKPRQTSLLEIAK